MKDSQTVIMDSLKSLSQWIEQEGPYGWDPYDALHSPWNQKLKNPYLRVLLIQINKYSPLNLRPRLKVRKGIDLKGTALLTQAYATMYRLTQDNSYLKKTIEGLAFIASNSLQKDYGYDCWASHYYPYVAIDRNQLNYNSPDIIGTSQSIMALSEGYRISHESRFLKMALSASRFLTDQLYQEDAIFPYFKYTVSEVTREIVPNASAHAVEALSSVLRIQSNCAIRDICENTVQALAEIQRKNGSWVYSMYPNGTVKRIQLDFHQGYLIDSLLSFLPHSENEDDIALCIRKGAKFYKEVLFSDDGRSYYRHPLPYPVDIHNQAQGIITFSKLGCLDRQYAEFANKVAVWTINNMQDPSGYFYYQKWPIFDNKVPYMRWAQAWMMLALAKFSGLGVDADD